MKYYEETPIISTFSIVAHDPEAKEWGVATQSKFLAVGSVVPWAQANAGAIATQAVGNPSFGLNGLALLSKSNSAEEVLEILLKNDTKREWRQIGIVDSNGSSVTFTGKYCSAWAGGANGPNFACQGNFLESEEVISEIAHVYQTTMEPLPERLVAALDGGQRAGGDRRGMQSAALYVVKPEGGYGGTGDRYVDLRVDDHPTTIMELKRLLSAHRLYFQRSTPEELIPFDCDLLKEVKNIIKTEGFQPDDASNYYDVQTKDALRKYFSFMNFEAKWSDEAKINLHVLNIMRNNCSGQSRCERVDALDS